MAACSAATPARPRQHPSVLLALLLLPLLLLLLLPLLLAQAGRTWRCGENLPRPLDAFKQLLQRQRPLSRPQALRAVPLQLRVPKGGRQHAQGCGCGAWPPSEANHLRSCEGTTVASRRALGCARGQARGSAGAARGSAGAAASPAAARPPRGAPPGPRLPPACTRGPLRRRPSRALQRRQPRAWCAL